MTNLAPPDPRQLNRLRSTVKPKHRAPTAAPANGNSGSGSRAAVSNKSKEGSFVKGSFVKGSFVQGSFVKFNLVAPNRQAAAVKVSQGRTPAVKVLT